MIDMLEELPRQSMEMAYVATIAGSIEDFVSGLGFVVKDDCDDLDEFKTITLKHGRLVVELMRYRGTPPNIFCLFIPAQQRDWEEQFKELVEVLRIEPSSVSHIADNFFMTPQVAEPRIEYFPTTP